ncbi:hypothetical protein [Desulfitobacterium sp.]|uniref:hypothetical protein n=1 Tax=Desulfitobacterium sp. TaxID=49981 RepID=UPI002CF621FB|nr:hypothetical protein [Desulfitobacterium sp.]HVJ48982.1 hypothetical protein [Desulfitobacterium sp.]
MAATVTATQMKPAAFSNIKELDVNQNAEVFKKITESSNHKMMKDKILQGKYVLEKEHLIETLDPNDNKPIEVVTLPFVQDNKPGMIVTATKDGQSVTEAFQGLSSDGKTIEIETSAVIDNKIVSKTSKYQIDNHKKLADLFIKPAYADAHSFCVDFCNFMCGAGFGTVACTVACDAFSGGTGVILCPAICYSLTWSACNYGCPWYCTNVIGY